MTSPSKIIESLNFSAESQKAEKLNPHHVPGTRPFALTTIQQGWVEDSTGANRIHQTVQEGWFRKIPTQQGRVSD